MVVGRGLVVEESSAGELCEEREEVSGVAVAGLCGLCSIYFAYLASKGRVLGRSVSVGVHGG